MLGRRAQASTENGLAIAAAASASFIAARACYPEVTPEVEALLFVVLALIAGGHLLWWWLAAVLGICAAVDDGLLSSRR